MECLAKKIAVYAIHTNLDNVVPGLNTYAAKLLSLKQVQVLAPKTGTLSKLVTFIPMQSYEEVSSALYKAGAGRTGHYSNCGFRIQGKGTFLPNEGAHPYLGKKHQLEEVEELRLETLVPTYKIREVCQALISSHPYEEVAYYTEPLSNLDSYVGAGVVGNLPNSLSSKKFLALLKKTFSLAHIRHTIAHKDISRVAFCGGSGSFLIDAAIRKHADVLVTADIKYHDFFDMSAQLMLCDIGHAESEAHVKILLHKEIQKKFPNIAVHTSNISTNPIQYT